MTTGSDVEIKGEVAPGFEKVTEAFASNFRERGEVGAALAVTLQGKPVVDIWGGWKDAALGVSAWDSTTKGHRLTH